MNTEKTNLENESPALSKGDVTCRYFQCWKCGCKTKTDGKAPDYMCTNSFPVRISGICGGSFTNEITEEQYNCR